MKIFLKKAILTGCFLGSLNAPMLHAIRLMHANVDASSAEHATFAQPIACTLFSSSGNLYTGTAQQGAQHYALSRGRLETRALHPIAGQYALLTQFPSIDKNAKKGDKEAEEKRKQEQRTANPLFDAAIAHIALVNPQSEAPVVVLKDEPHNLYFFDKYPQDGAHFIHKIESVRDASGTGIAGIMGLATTKNQTPVFIFASVKPAQGVCGDAGTGIAVMRVRENKVTEEIPDDKGAMKKVERTYISFAQACGKVGTYTQENPPIACAAALDRSSTCVKIGGDLAALNAVAMTYDTMLSRLYIAVTGQAGTQHQDGMCAIVVGQLVKDADGQMLLRPFAPDLFTQSHGNEIIGAKGASSCVSIHQLETLHTSTLLPYLIVLGGNGDAQSTKRTVYALPLVDKRNDQKLRVGFDAECGTLAAKDAVPRELFSDKEHQLATRVFEKQATTAADIYTTELSCSNAPAHVGGGPLPYGDITRVYVKHDGVYALVTTADPGKTAGVFFSQALFDAVGVVKGWTTWRRVAGVYYGVSDMFMHDISGDAMFVVNDGNNQMTNVVRTEWGTGYAAGIGPLVQVLNTLYSPENGGIHGLYTSPASKHGLHDIDVMIALGAHGLTLAQTGIGSGAFMRPLRGAEVINQPVVCSDGALTSFQPTRLLTITGGVLHELGPLVTAEIACSSDTNDGYLCVGGVGGVAVMRRPNGTGWNTQSGLGDYLVGLDTTMAFERLGNYRFVRRLVNDGAYLYVLTATELDRYEVTDLTLPPVRLASIQENPWAPKFDRFFDVVVSDDLVLLATTRGLYRTSDGVCAADVSAMREGAWTLVQLPNYDGAVLQLYACSATGSACDVARGPGGMVYALAGHRGRDYSRVYRLAIGSVETIGVAADTVAVMHDKKHESTLSSFVPFGKFCDHFATDGVIRMRTRNKDMHAQAHVMTSAISRLPLPLEEAATISALERSTASGVWLVAGDFGLLVNE